MSATDKPNLNIPLGATINPRGIAGYTDIITNSLDQLKRNSFYEIEHNAVSGRVTASLTKRPGVSLNALSYGASGQIAYLLAVAAGSLGSDTMWVFSKSGNDLRASDSNTTTVIVAEAGLLPAYVERIAISGTDTLVLQCVNAGTPDQRVFYSTTIGTWTEITDPQFPASTIKGKMEPMDGWMFGLASTANGQSAVFNSDLNSIANWTDGNYILKQIQYDGNKGFAKLGKKLLAFGIETVEVFGNAGNESGSPLITIPEMVGEIGMFHQFISGYTHYYAVLGNKLYFVGRSNHSGVGLYCFDGARFEKVSRGAFDKVLSELAYSHSLFSVNEIIWGGKEAVAIQATATTAATQRWFMYFPEWRDWFEWSSTVFTPVNDAALFLGVGTNQHRLYSLQISSTNDWQDAGTNYQWLHQFQLPRDGNHRHVMHMCQLIGDTAGSAQNISAEFSDDDGQTWTTSRDINMTTAQKMLTRCGAYRERLVRLSYTGSLEVRLEKFAARIDA